MRTKFFFASCLALAAAASCGSPSLRAQGETCVASSECATDLVCDFGQTPAVCTGMGSPRVDANPNAPDANPQAPDANPQAPDAMRTPIDAAPPIDAMPIDAAPPIDAMPID